MTPPVPLKPRVPRKPPLLMCDLITYGAGAIPPPAGFLPAYVQDRGWYKPDPTGTREVFDPELVKSYFASRPAGSLVVLDEERAEWSTDPRSGLSPEEIENNKRLLRQWSAAGLAGGPLVKRGIYGVFPRTNFWCSATKGGSDAAYAKWKAGGTLTDHENWLAYKFYSWSDDTRRWTPTAANAEQYGVSDYNAWRDSNTADTRGLFLNGKVNTAGGLAPAVDVITPSLYDFYAGDRDADLAYLTDTIAESRRIGGGRLVLPVVWANYHDSNPTDGNKPIDLDDWRAQMRCVLTLADGLLLWGFDPKRHADHLAVILEEAASVA